MSSIIGNKLKINLFGESHGPGIGVVIDGLPPGIPLDLDYIDKEMKRRAPGSSPLTSSRKEGDEYEILSGFFQGKTTGSPLASIIYNEDKKSQDYTEIKNLLRPSHSDYTAYIKYSSNSDYRGGGHFSGRLTAPLLFAGGIARQILENKDIFIGSRIKSIYDIDDDDREVTLETLKKLRRMTFPTLSPEKGKLMTDKILKCKGEGNSLGGVVEAYVFNLPTGYGQPFFDSVESKISHMIFSIPGIKGIEFGTGFNITRMTGKEANDEFQIKEGKIVTKTNNSGGILGGISNGMPIIFRTAIKPTPSIGLPQNTVNVEKMEESILNIKGRHDPCIVTRVLPVIEGACALVILDLILERDGEEWI